MRNGCLFVAAFLGLLSAGTAIGADQEAQSGEWPTFRRNGSLDGHAAGKGRITSPRIVWRKYVGRTETQLLVEPATAPSVLTVPPGSETVTRAKEVSQRRWSPDRPYGQIAGQRQPILPTATETYADIFPEIPGLEKIEVASGFNLPTRNGQWEAGPARCLAWKAGRWEPVWQTGPISHCFAPYPLVGDFDGDGRLELAVLPWANCKSSMPAPAP